MHINSLSINGFRNLDLNKTPLSPKFNLISGNNGAGKTSLLEAIIMLAHGKSFRQPKNLHCLNHAAEQWLITLELQTKSNTSPLHVGMTKNKSGDRQLNLNQAAIKTHTDIAKQLQCLIIGADSHFILQSGPSERRSIIDWGLFHVEHQFLPVWRTYQKTLGQRNAALKSHAATSEIEQWTLKLAEYGNSLNTMRENHVSELRPIFREVMEDISGLDNLDFSYYPGFNNDISLYEQYQNQLFKDKMLGFTQSGPHRSDLKINSDNILAKDFLSQGQQKCIAYAIKLAQCVYLSYQGKKPLLLIDDMPSELDVDKQKKIMRFCQALDNQVIITGIETEHLCSMLKTKPYTIKLEHGYAGTTNAITAANGCV